MFLSPLLMDPRQPRTLVNADTGTTLANRVEAAIDSQSRRRGLLGRSGLDDEALVIAPCNGVHTCFMRFPIDIIIVNREGYITWVARRTGMADCDVNRIRNHRARGRND